MRSSKRGVNVTSYSLPRFSVVSAEHGGDPQTFGAQCSTFAFAHQYVPEQATATQGYCEFH